MANSILQKPNDIFYKPNEELNGTYFDVFGIITSGSQDANVYIPFGKMANLVSSINITRIQNQLMKM